MAMDMAMDLAMAIAKIKVFFHEGCQVQLQVWEVWASQLARIMFRIMFRNCVLS